MKRVARIAVRVCGVLVVLAIGAAVYQEFRTRWELREFRPPGKLVSLGAGWMHLNCIGAGSPTVVISGGTGVLSLQWSKIQRELARGARVCFGDRPGFAWSSPPLGAHTAAQAAEELFTALREAGENGPYVLVGESYGGYLVRLFQGKHPGDVTGVALIESAHERQWDEIPQTAALMRQVKQQLRIGAWLSRLGVLRWSIPDRGLDLPADVRPALVAFLGQTAIVDAAITELDGVFESATQVRGTGSLGHVPLVVLSAGRSLKQFFPNAEESELRRMNATWMSLQNELCGLSTNCTHLVEPDAKHGIAREKPDVVIDAIRRVLSMAREHQK